MPTTDLNTTADISTTDDQEVKTVRELDNWIPGEHVSFYYTPEPMYTENDVYVPEEFADDSRDTDNLSEEARNTLLDLDNTLSKMDEAPRRIEIEQAWRNNHYDRGYQFLLRHRNGGWVLPQSGSQYDAKNQQILTSRYHTNIFAEKNDIIVAALSNEVPVVEFFPINPKHPPDVQMADSSEDLKDIWAKNNNLQQIERDSARIMCVSGRVLCVTRYELNGDEFGYETDDQPLVSEDLQDPPKDTEQTEGSEQFEEENDSVVKSGRRPRGRVITFVLDKLAHQVPMNVDKQGDMPGLSYVKDIDIAIAKARYPWIAAKIEGGGDGTGTTEFGRIARENVNQNIPGTYVTGDALNRHTTEKFTLMRKSYFFDAKVKPEVREELLSKFPDGCLLVKVGTNFAFARNENLDDTCKVVQPNAGRGQNRRPLMESLVPIQDFLNELVCLALDFAKRTVPKKWMNAEAFNIEAVKGQGNIPGTIGPFQPQVGLTTADQYIMVEPTPQPQPWLIQFIQWVITALSEQISGAMPSLFGKGITGQVGSEGVALQRDQAMQRMSCPWSALQDMFAAAARQAVMLMARCACDDINDVIPGRGPVHVKVNNLKGNVLCYPQSNPSFPESWAAKETRVMSIIDKIATLPEGNPLGQMFFDPENLDEIKSLIRIRNFTISGADSVVKQRAEFEVLLRQAPLKNPKKLMGQKLLEDATKGMAGHLLNGETPPAGAAEKMTEMEKMLEAMPDMISSVPIRDDASENHSVEARTCFNFMNSSDGRKYQHGTKEQQDGFQNVYLHWKEHTAAAAKLAAEAAPKPTPKVNFSAQVTKLPPDAEAQVLESAGIHTPAENVQDNRVVENNMEVQKKVVPDLLWSQEAPGSKP